MRLVWYARVRGDAREDAEVTCGGASRGTSLGERIEMQARLSSMTQMLNSSSVYFKLYFRC
jgi:hypothetical protein